MTSRPPVDDEEAWAIWRSRWAIRSDTIYLNHGSFGPPPLAVQESRRQWQQRLDANPMDFFIRQLEGELLNVRQQLAAFVGTQAENLVLVDNATYGMNVVADNFPLAAGDEVLFSDHEYGAVRRIWQRRCDRTGARLRIVELPLPMESAEQVSDAILGAITPQTKLLVISHITSPTAITLPVAEITRRVRAQRDASGHGVTGLPSQGVAVCIDGPHAIAQLPLEIDALDCDFYTASCHKWLSAPLGTGFLYVHPRWQVQMQPPILSWGKTDTEAAPETWCDEFQWLGTRDPSALLAIPTAIALLEDLGLDAFRARTHHLAKYARSQLLEFTDQQPITPDDEQWYTSMAHVPLPDGDARALQRALWGQYGIEVPIIAFAGRRWIRVSCHLYTQRSDIDTLWAALRELL